MTLIGKLITTVFFYFCIYYRNSFFELTVGLDVAVIASCCYNNKVSSVMDVTIAGLPWCPVWCRLVTVPTDPFTTFTSPSSPFLSEWVKCPPGNTQNGGTVLLIASLMAGSESFSFRDIRM